MFEVAELVFLVIKYFRSIVSMIRTNYLCMIMNKVIPGCAVVAQDLNHIWRLYVNNNDAREKLLLARLHFDTVTLYACDSCINLKKPPEGVIIKDIPLPICNETMINHLQCLLPRLC